MIVFDLDLIATKINLSLVPIFTNEAFCFVANLNFQRGLDSVDAERNLFFGRVCVGALPRTRPLGRAVAEGQVMAYEVAHCDDRDWANHTHALLARPRFPVSSLQSILAIGILMAGLGHTLCLGVSDRLWMAAFTT